MEFRNIPARIKLWKPPKHSCEVRQVFPKTVGDAILARRSIVVDCYMCGQRAVDLTSIAPDTLISAALEQELDKAQGNCLNRVCGARVALK